MHLPTTVGGLRFPASIVRRTTLLVLGSFVATACYAVTIRADLGLGPLFVLQDGVAIHAGIAIGTSVMVVGFALVLVAFALRAPLGPGTLLLPVIGGVTLDAMLPHVPVLQGWPWRLASVIIATWLMALGGAMMIRAAVGVSAYDAVMLGLGRLLRRPLAPIRLAMEGTVLLGGWLLGGAVGVGTVITGVLIGPGIQFWLRIIGNPADNTAPGATPQALPPRPLRGLIGRFGRRTGLLPG